jgi:hypothetical protein
MALIYCAAAGADAVGVFETRAKALQDQAEAHREMYDGQQLFKQGKHRDCQKSNGKPPTQEGMGWPASAQ